ncbi:MAG: SDR family NAD(P)-dependent oxidoreductase [Archangium sp.]|nr:SDR family NAD(P)-dependent oxidoreductase [Archangium sp.]
MSDLPWKNALLTGASSGLGRGLALWLAKRNVKVYAAARRLDQLEALKAEAGDNIVPLKLDVADASAAFLAVQKLDQDCGGLELVIANAGVGEDTRPKKLNWDSVKKMIDVNVTGATATLTAALPAMIERKKGHLVGISSLAGLIPLPQSSTYCATKAYLAMFLESLRLDVDKYGIAVTSIHPGFVKSEMTAKNKPGSMPFLLETDDAVERMGKAMVRKAKVFTFPWQLSSIISLGSSLPRPLRTPLLQRLR